jgi:uncharacterized protein YndB with AHSA1/START domain
MSANTAVNQAVKPSLTLKRRLNAPAEKVYAAWTNPQHLVKWFGPDAGSVSKAETDVRVGGRYTIAFQTDDGEKHQVGGIYREVVPNEKLAFTWAWITMPERESFVTITIKRDGEGCILTLHHERFADEETRDRHEWGWNGCLDKLARFAEAA